MFFKNSIPRPLGALGAFIASAGLAVTLATPASADSMGIYGTALACDKQGRYIVESSEPRYVDYKVWNCIKTDTGKWLLNVSE